jgi:hypothetical protein
MSADVAMRQLTATMCRYGSDSDAAVIGCRDRFTSNTGLECGQPWRPFRAINGLVDRNKIAPSFDHLIGDGKQRRWDSETERPRCFKVEDKLDFGRQLNRQFTWLRAA